MSQREANSHHRLKEEYPDGGEPVKAWMVVGRGNKPIFEVEGHLHGCWNHTLIFKSKRLAKDWAKTIFEGKVVRVEIIRL